jgi:molecular chaperone GrpE
VSDFRIDSEASDATPGKAPAPLAEQLSALEAELARARDAHLRAEADLQNARRRAARDLEEGERRGEARALGSYLALLDDLARALEAAAQAGESGPLVEGVKLVLTRAADELARLGVTVIDPLGAPFDPNQHEALLAATSDDHPAGHVTQVVARGYRQGERLLRPARVIVSHGSGGDGGAAPPAAPSGGTESGA